MTPKDKKYNIIANEFVFSENANPELVSNLLKSYQSTPSTLKGYSKKTKAYKDSIAETRQENYDGRWYQSGWVINNKNQILADKVQSIPFLYGDRYLRPLDELPYSKLESTGVYVDSIWSGYNNNDSRLPSGIQADLRICGFINSGFSGSYKEVMPYRNLFEIFDHKDVQVGDMGSRWFHTGEERVKGEFIAKNNIYFLSGLGPQNLLDENLKLLIFSNHIKGKQTVSEGRQLPEPIAFYWYPEKQNTTRFSIFAFTGDLNIKYIPIQVSGSVGPKSKQIAGGDLFQYKNSKWGLGDYQIQLTGIYPETLSKTFSIANTGDVIVDFYFSPEDPTISIESKAFPLNTKYTWTDEAVRIYPSGTNIQVYNLSSKRNSNFNIKVYTTGLLGSLNTEITKNIAIYQITGESLIVGETGYNGQQAFKPLTINKIIPVKIRALANDTKVKVDDFFFKYEGVSGQGFTQTLPSYANTIGKNTLTFTTGGLNFETKWFGLTYYSTGNNLNQPEVAADLNRKLKKLDQFSNTGAFSDLKRIYPVLSGEAYLYVDSNRDWLNIDASEKTLRWISGVSGFFSSPTSFDPKTGALQVDVQIAIKTLNLLPPSPNTNGSNFNVTFTGNKLGILNQAYPNNFALNTENTGFILMPMQLQRGKTYRFLQTDSTDTSDITFNFFNNEISEYHEYNPDYNAVKDKDYRLKTIKVPNDYMGQTFIFEANNASVKWTGIFNVYTNTGVAGGKKINDFSQTYNNSGEWFLFGFEPNYKLFQPYDGFLTFQEVFPSGSPKINDTLSNLKVNNYKNGPYLSTVFYSNVENAIEVLNNFEQNNSNPCYLTTTGNKTIISARRNWWRLKVKNKDGSHTTGCYTNEEFIALSSKVYSERAPVIKVIPGERYNFVRPAMTNFQITGLQLRFSQSLGDPIVNNTGYNPSLITGVLTGGQILNNYIRKTHQTDPNLLVNLFGDTKTKFFEYITFTVPTGYSTQNTGLQVINYGVNYTGYGKNFGSSSLLPYENLLNTNTSDSSYLFTTTPVFSGDVMVRSTDTSRGTDKYTFIISGVGSEVDSIGRYTNP